MEVVNMKQFYACEPRYDWNNSKRSHEWVEYDINTLIFDEAEVMLECDDSLSELTDEEFYELVRKKADEIKNELIRNGIYRNEYGQVMFLYC
jgi:hypothetical protein